MAEERATGLVLLNPKGGCGRTTTALNLAVELAGRGGRTLLVDADPQGHCARGLGLTPDAFGDRPVAAVPELVLRTAPEATAGQVRTATEGFRWVLVDTPAGPATPWRALLDWADLVVVPTWPHPLGEAAVTTLMAGADAWWRRAAVLPVGYDRRVPAHRAMVERLTVHLGPDRILRGIRPDIRLAEAFGEGCPARVLTPRGRGVMDYYLFANEVERLIASKEGNR